MTTNLQTAFQRETITVDFSSVSQTVRTVITTLRVWRRRSRTRAELRQLEYASLVDIGITREQAEQEAAKPFWQE